VCINIEDVNEMHCCAQVMCKNKINYNISIIIIIIIIITTTTTTTIIIIIIIINKEREY
jgi:hypothetical protein